MFNIIYKKTDLISNVLIYNRLIYPFLQGKIGSKTLKILIYIYSKYIVSK